MKEEKRTQLNDNYFYTYDGNSYSLFSEFEKDVKGEIKKVKNFIGHYGNFKLLLKSVLNECGRCDTVSEVMERLNQFEQIINKG